MRFVESLHLECKHCPYSGSCVYSSPRLRDSTKLTVAFEINNVMTMLTHELCKGHETGPLALCKIGIILLSQSHVVATILSYFASDMTRIPWWQQTVQYLGHVSHSVLLLRLSIRHNNTFIFILNTQRYSIIDVI